MCDRTVCSSKQENNNFGKCIKLMDTITATSLAQNDIDERPPKRKVPSENGHSEVIGDEKFHSKIERLTPKSVDEAVRCCLVAYAALPSSGKPGPDEWTVLSGVVELRDNMWCVIALATGSWSAPATSLHPSGAYLHDAHAEVLARRALVRYSYNRVISDSSPPDNILLYTSRAPCGAAAHVLCGDTGAWCLNGSKPGGGDADRVRTKPGRGTRTLSVSCTDKIARWARQGMQGALLHSAGIKIRLRHIVVGGGGECPQLVRAFRLGLSPSVTDTHCYTTSLHFEAMESAHRTRVTHTAIVWAQGDKAPEVIVRGKKLGLTKKAAFSAKTAANVSKYRLYQYFLEIMKMNPELKHKLVGDEPPHTIPYNAMKLKSVEYQKQWLELKNTVFKEWTVKPDIWNFCVEPLEHFAQ